MIGHKGFKFSEFDGDHHGVVIGKFGEDQSKILPMKLFFPFKFPGCGHNLMPE